MRLAQQLKWLEEPRTFVYDPNGVNASQESLSHSDVLRLFSHFVTEKSVMAEILVNSFPFIFVDESQDTDRRVINALFRLQEKHPDKIVIGLFGDVMQRIFGGGESELGKSIPLKWVEFDKQMNHRSARRIVGLGNSIRDEDDGRKQYARIGSDEGIVRYFLLPQSAENKEAIEEKIRTSMAEITGDHGWTEARSNETAVLLLEHKMVSRRMGFFELTEALTRSDKIKGRIFEGDSAELNFFSEVVLPLAEAGRNNDTFEAMALLRKNDSPLLREEVFAESATDPLLAARTAEKTFRELLKNEQITLLEVLNCIARSELLEIPKKLRSFIHQNDEEIVRAVDEEFDLADTDEVSEDDEGAGGDEIDAWARALQTPFYQVRGYRDYIEEEAIYRTHQGVKGNEFERVMVIMDDDEAGGFTFSYEQYFGAKVPSAATIRKMEAGEETGLDRTRRLFYVTSTRAKSSLVHVIYSSDVEAVRANLVERGFAADHEINLVES